MKNKKLLIIEDDTALSNTLKDYLSTEGYEIFTAFDGEEGVEKVSSVNPDLILLDIILPKKNGYEVLKEIKEKEEISNIPVIILTNLGSLNDVEKALGLGAQMYMIKSDYKLEEIKQKVAQIINKQ